jgi:hypothetical protein
VLKFVEEHVRKKKKFIAKARELLGTDDNEK